MDSNNNAPQEDASCASSTTMEASLDPSILLATERALRKQRQRQAKALRKAQREQQRIKTTIRSDHRPEVRMAAAAMLFQASETTHQYPIEPEPDYKDDDEDEAPIVVGTAADRVVSLVDLSLSEFSLSMIRHPARSILELDVSHNRLSDLPGLSALKHLVSLNIRRNEFRTLPASLAQLPHLARLNASRNQLRPSADFLLLLTKLPCLESLDLTLNKKCFTASLLELVTWTLPSVAADMTVTWPPPSGAYVGTCPGTRDPERLRSQLEPWTTLQLRQRLIDTFGHAPYDRHGSSPPPGRAHVMALLLKEYQALGPRTLVRSLGVPVPSAVMEVVRQELNAWSDRFDAQERPMIHATKYMILRSPTEAQEKVERLGSRKAQVAMRKYQQNLSLWKAAKAAMATVDGEFAERFTGLAVTKGFRGSPHIDTTNIGPFYGLATGDFGDGTGGVRVELDPTTVCEVNTKDRLGRVDGRFPHWVGPYDEQTTRYSLIFYLTEGVVQPKTTAVFGDIFDDSGSSLQVPAKGS